MEGEGRWLIEMDCLNTRLYRWNTVHGLGVMHDGLHHGQPGADPDFPIGGAQQSFINLDKFLVDKRGREAPEY